MKYESWSFVNAKGAPEWLQMRPQKRGMVYRIYYVKLGYNIRAVLEGRFESWRDAAQAGEPIYDRKKQQSRSKAGIDGKRPDKILCSDVVAEILKQKERQKVRPSTLDGVELFYRKHILPFLGGDVEENGVKGARRVYVEGECPYAIDLTPRVWAKYVDHFRRKSPGSPLFNHWKHFVTLFKFCKEHKLIDQFYKLEYSEKRDDNREEGFVLSHDEIQKMIFRASTRNWRNRIIIQRWTGGRPGEVRNLRKKAIRMKDVLWEPNLFIQGDEILIRYYKFDTKNKKEREFYIESEIVKHAIREQMERYPDSPFLFPNERDHSRPMDKCLNGWYSTLERAGIDPNYTPHDLRHTYLTEMFKASNEWAIICYQAGLTLDEAQRTYLHMDADDTRTIAKLAKEQAQHVAQLLA